MGLLSANFGKPGFDYSTGFSTTVRQENVTAERLAPIDGLVDTHTTQWFDNGVDAGYNFDLALVVSNTLAIDYRLTVKGGRTIELAGLCVKQ